MHFAVVAYPAAPVRKKPAQSREMVNQLLFGEYVKILKIKKNGWVQVEGLHDGYKGWMTHSFLKTVDKSVLNEKNIFVTDTMLSPISVADQVMHIPFGSSLPLFDGGTGKLGETEYRYNGSFLNREVQKPAFEIIQQFSKAWLNVPYLWGGRTPLGVDCSGFTQVIFKMIGIDLPRDAWQQAQTGTVVKKFSQSQPGDLAFFDNKEDIVHVGIILENGQIIHSSGKVKTDNINKKGIVDAQGKLINRLRAIRRMW